jgi:hypothetical protein
MRTQALGHGGHTFHVRARDAAGNPDPTPATRSVVVDTSSTTPPRASSEAPSQPPPAAGDSREPAPSAPTDGGGAAADTMPPAGALTVPRQRLRAIARKGLTARLACGEACTWRVAVTLDRRAAARIGMSRKQLTIGSRSGAFGTAGTRTVTVKLTRAARRRLARLRSLRVTVRVELRDAAGNPRVVKRTVTVRR